MGNKSSRARRLVTDKETLLYGYLRPLFRQISSEEPQDILEDIVTIIYECFFQEFDEWAASLIYDSHEQNTQCLKITDITIESPYIEFKSFKRMGLLFQDPMISEGIWIFEMKVIKREWAMSIGIIVEGNNEDPNKDREWMKGWHGYYHDGLSSTVCSNSDRVHNEIQPNQEWKGQRVGVWINFDELRLAPIFDGNIQQKYAVDIASGCDFCFDVWFARKNEVVQIYAPYRVS